MDIILASNNHGKIKEFQQLLSSLDVFLLPQATFNINSAAETGLTFVENALLKARHASKSGALPAIADDSGLEVDCLNGAPGIKSARFAGKNSSDIENNRLLLERLRGIPPSQRTARYQCIIVYLRHPNDPIPIICHGTWEGFIAENSLGSNGFGYDPLFIVKETRCRAAELGQDEKNKISHRSKAMKQLLNVLRNQEKI